VGHKDKERVMCFHLSSLSLSSLSLQHQRKKWCSTNKSSPANKAGIHGYALWLNESYQFSCSMSTTNSKITFALLPIFPILPTSLQDVNN
jgi:hypothetical protein